MIKKKIVCTLILVFWFIQSTLSVFAVSEQFASVDSFKGYSDVKQTDWFYEAVKLTSETGLMLGIGDDKFAPMQNITVEQGVVLISRLHQKYYQNTEIEATDNDWFKPFYNYAVKHELIKKEEYNSNTTMSREFFAVVISRVFPPEAFPDINNVTSIVDYEKGSNAWNSVIMLYNAGVLTGSDEDGAFYPQNSITRAEISALISRVIRPDTRVRLDTETSHDVQKVPLNFDGISILDFDGKFIYVVDEASEKQAVFDLNGEQIIDWREGMIYEQSDGFFRIETKKVTYNFENELNIIQGSGDTIKTSYYSIENGYIGSADIRVGKDFKDGYAIVLTADEQTKAIRSDGSVAYDFDNNLYYFADLKMVGKYAVISDWKGLSTFINVETGEKIDRPYFEVSSLFSGVAVVRYYEENLPKANLIDEDLNEIFKTDYEYIAYGIDYFPVRNEQSLWGAVDRQGNLVVPMEYTNIEFINAEIGIFYNEDSATFVGKFSNAEMVLDIPYVENFGYNFYDTYYVKFNSVTHEAWVYNYSGDELLNIENVFDATFFRDSFLYKESGAYYHYIVHVK